MSEAKQSCSTAELGGLPEPVGFRSRYRSEPGMIGHYPWTYADHRRRKYDRPECEYEELFTAEQVRAAVAAELERIAGEPPISGNTLAQARVLIAAAQFK